MPWELKKKPPGVTSAVSRVRHLALAGPALELEYRLAEVARALRPALGQRAAVRVHRDPAVDQHPTLFLVPVLLEERPGLARTAPTRCSRASRA